MSPPLGLSRDKSVAYTVGDWSTAVTLLENEVETVLGLGLSKCVH